MATRARTRGAFKSRLEPLPLSGLAPLSSSLRTSPGDRIGRTPLTGLLDGGSDGGLVSPSSWLRTPPVPTPRRLDSTNYQAPLSKLIPPGSSPRIPLPGTANVFGEDPKKGGRSHAHGEASKLLSIGPTSHVNPAKPPSGLVGLHSLHMERKKQHNQAKLNSLQVKEESRNVDPMQTANGQQQLSFQPPPSALNLSQMPKSLNSRPSLQTAQSSVSSPLPQVDRRSLQTQIPLMQAMPAQHQWPANGMYQPQLLPPVINQAKPVLPALIPSSHAMTAAMMFAKEGVAKKILPMDKSKILPGMHGMINGVVAKQEATSTQIARAIRNREAASKSRLNAKIKVRKLESENKVLRARVEILEKDSKELREKYGLPPLKEPEYNIDVDEDITLPLKRVRRK